LPLLPPPVTRSRSPSRPLSLPLSRFLFWSRFDESVSDVIYGQKLNWGEIQGLG
jgi:hypothetical protein